MVRNATFGIGIAFHTTPATVIAHSFQRVDESANSGVMNLNSTETASRLD
jgi:hypothetical protein